MSTITIKPSFSVNGEQVQEGCFADDVFKGFFAQDAFKSLLARTVEFKEVTDVDVTQIQGLFHNYIMNELMIEPVGHDLMGEFLQTYDTAKIAHVKFSHEESNDTISIAFALTTKENVTAEEREDRRNMAYGYDDWDEEEDFE